MDSASSIANSCSLRQCKSRRDIVVEGRATMFHVLGYPVICEVSLRTHEVVGDLDENDLSPTPLPQLRPLLHEIRLDDTTYTSSVRRFRHWFRENVMERTLKIANDAFLVVKASSEQFQEANAPLFPLTVQLSADQAQDEIQWILRRRQILEEQLASNPADNPVEKSQYKTALCGMQSMIWLLAGSWVPNLIPDGCPTGYICSRVEQLVDDVDMSEFEGHQTALSSNRDHTLPVPSDSTLMMFLMCIYLKAPNWNLQLFHMKPPKARNGPLVLMNIDPLADSAFTAFLTSVPVQRQSKSNAFILRHRTWMTGSSESVVTLMLDGKLRANFGGMAGFFEAMTVFLAYHRVKFKNIGGCQFDLMQGMDWVFEDQILHPEDDQRNRN